MKKSTGYAIGKGKGNTERGWIFEVQERGATDNTVIVLDPFANGVHKFEAFRSDLVELTEYEFNTIHDMIADGVPDVYEVLTEYLIERGGPVENGIPEEKSEGA